jgi:Protein of unknwon function (DUF3310)
MPKQSDWLSNQVNIATVCSICKKYLSYGDKRALLEGQQVCVPCYEMAKDIGKKIEKAVNKHVEKYNEPEHYHEFELDTIEFLKRGFPPQVLTGFLIGNIIKYTQRFEYKNGEDDLVKVVDYAKRLQDWYKETHS